ncbi:MAG: 4Fe-4S dicluster domain-containing protein [Hyphomicrobiales bacterium]|nr:4Fe-4S dicluster domain-containing protein [Hyphomicrobiales bacterium]MCP5002240.1 4Fe-4S dicluster domain-containing protein [Hyphomicrobiales bacterium]
MCSCENTVSIDAKKLGQDLGLDRTPEIYNNLCRSQLAEFRKIIAGNKGRRATVACTQEAPLFREVASGRGENDISFVNIREKAGWSEQGSKAGAKISALIAESLYETVPTGLVPIVSKGDCFVYGGGQQALDVAQKLSNRLNVTLILTDVDGVIVPANTRFPVMKGNIGKLSGVLGEFEVTIDGHAALRPSSRSELKFQPEQNGVELSCDLFFDLSGNGPLIATSHGRDGYVCVEPGYPANISQAMYDIVGLVGEFEKPIFVSYDQDICAHSRNGITACSKCIDNCPSSAISPDGDGVRIDHKICDGCGHCAAGCPTGAVSYTYPGRLDVVGRCQTLVSTYLNADGRFPLLLVHEENLGGAVISALARFGDGLAPNVLPFGVHSITHLGHEVLSAFFTAGVQSVVLLAPLKKRDELDVLTSQVGLTNEFLKAMEFDASMRVELIVDDDPDTVSQALSKFRDFTGTGTQASNNFTASRSKRETARLALANLNAVAPAAQEVLDLPMGAPYGRITIDTERCTLCLACVGACPANALSDNGARPQISFTEAACVQCTLCQATCPEKAISLESRYNFNNSALSASILNFEEPLDCIQCGKPFGSKSAIEKVIAVLAGKNAMFRTSAQLDMLKMCENCRVAAMTGSETDPMAFGTVPKTLTAKDLDPDDDDPTRH